MKRLPLIVSFLLFIALCASAAYWAMQLFKPPLRPVAAPPRAQQAEIRPEAAASLFGSRSTGNAAVASNYQLRGVIFSGNPHDSVAIISTEGKPAQAIRANAEVAPGVTIKEVHRDYVLVAEGGGTKRIELPESAKGQEGISPAPTPPTMPRAAPAPAPQLPGSGMSTRAQAAAQAASQAQTAPPPQPAVPPPGVPPIPPVPQAVPQQQIAPAANVPTPVPGQPLPGQAIQGQVPPGAITAPPAMGVNPPPVAQPGVVSPVPGTTNVPVAPNTVVVPQQPVVPGTQQAPGMLTPQQGTTR